MANAIRFALVINGRERGERFASEEDALTFFVNECDGGTARILDTMAGRKARVRVSVDDEWRFCAWTDRSARAGFVAREVL